MEHGSPIGLWMLPALCGAGFASSLYLLAANGPWQASPLRVARLAGEIGGGGGLAFWLVMSWLGFGSSTFAPAALGHAAVRAAIWAIVLWPFTAWRLERTLGVPYHQSYNLTTTVCGVMLLLFFIMVSATVIVHYL